jgi:regulator of PEP synthase PpsR (kinase-PPPase family)
MDKALDIYVVSDATGATAGAVVTSALVQFGGAESRVFRFPFTRTISEIEDIVERAATTGGVIVFTFVSPKLSETITALGQANNLVVVDLLGPLMKLFANSLDHHPVGTPGLYKGQLQDMFRMAEAIDYTISHDDGQGIDSLDAADLIILGVSRTGKTPTSIYLSCRKLKVANIPIVRGVPLPEDVAKLPIPKVGFTMEVERQVRLRSERSSRMGTRLPGYAERAHIMSELAYCENIYRTIPRIRTINVTDSSIEETSDWITHNVL